MSLVSPQILVFRSTSLSMGKVSVGQRNSVSCVVSHFLLENSITVFTRGLSGSSSVCCMNCRSLARVAILHPLFSTPLHYYHIVILISSDTHPDISTTSNNKCVKTLIHIVDFVVHWVDSSKKDSMALTIVDSPYEFFVHIVYLSSSQLILHSSAESECVFLL